MNFTSTVKQFGSERLIDIVSSRTKVETEVDKHKKKSIASF